MSENGNDGAGQGNAEQGNAGSVATVDSVNAEISSVRDAMAGADRHQTRGFNRQLNALYQQRSELDGTGGSMAIEPTGTVKTDADSHTGRDSVSKGAARDEANSPDAVLAAAKQAGLDFEGVNAENMSDAERDGVQNLTMIKNGDLKTLGPRLVSQAQELNFPPSSVQFLDQFANNIAQPGDPLSDRVLEVINEFILEQRT